MRNYPLWLFFVLVFVFAAVNTYRISLSRQAQLLGADDDIDVLMDGHADDAVKEAQEKYSVTLDYTPLSVKKVDDILGRLHAQHTKRKFDEKTLGRQSRLWGAYLGAVAKRVIPGKWELDSEAAGQGSLPLVFKAKDQTFPCAWAYKRIVNGEEDNVNHKFQILIMQRGKPLNGLTLPETSQTE